MATKTNKMKTTRKSTKTSVKPAETKTKAKGENPKKLGALDAAAYVLRQTGRAMKCAELIEQMAAKGLWSSPGGKTPQATLHAAISREIKVKGKESRFAKAGTGSFTAKS